MTRISEMAKRDLSTIGRNDIKAQTSLYHLTYNILVGIYALRHINVSDVVTQWNHLGVYSPELQAVVINVCERFNNELEERGDGWAPLCTFSDLLTERKLPELPSTLKHNDYVDIDKLRELLRRRFDEDKQEVELRHVQENP